MMGWIFIAVFVVFNLILMKAFPKHYTKRLFTLPTFTNKFEKIVSVIYALMFNLTMLASCFLSISSGITFILGLILYSISLTCICSALYSYAKTNPSLPVTKGIYKISRHPQQVFSCFMIIGIGLMLSQPIIIISGLLQLFLLYPSMVAQERFCEQKYGDKYREYLHKAPRYFIFKFKN